MKIFVINAGSSSIKYQLFEMPGAHPICSGQVENIGSSVTGTHQEAMEKILLLLTDSEHGFIRSVDEIDVVGHRIVHGGEAFTGATPITMAAKEKILSLFKLAPLHNPVNYICLELAAQKFPGAKQVAVFDTAFHLTLPEHAYRYAIPEKFYTTEGIRVYGFHGTSHQFVTNAAADFLGYLPERIITLHLGNGCSVTAVQQGLSIDTSMGFGPLAGLIMGTRSGDIDPSVIFHLADELGLHVDEIRNLLNKDSGMKALAGSNDMREVGQKYRDGDVPAILAIKMYVYRIKKYIGAYAAAMNGLDAVIFTAGVGENDALIRGLICDDMDFFGLKIDDEKNIGQQRSIREIQSEESRVKIMVIPTNEELAIAMQCYEMVTGTA